MSLDPIDAKARVYAEARDRLAGSVAALNVAIDALKREQLPVIKRHLRRAFELENELRGLVECNPQLFTKPRTVVLHGVKLGFQKGAGAISFDDPEHVCKLIEKKLPDMADVLISRNPKPVKKALQQLSVQQLKAIGCQVEEAGDRVVVKAVDSAVDKLVTALLKSMADKAGHDEEATEAT
jgi:hypothetical protein